MGANPNSTFSVGIVGATGLVGTKMLQILSERNFPLREVRCFASKKSAGKTLTCGERTIEVEDVENADFDGLDVVLMAVDADISRWLAPVITDSGATVIDNSSAWRLDPQVPLVVSEVNPHAVKNVPKRIIANPNCTTMIAMPVFNALREVAQLRRVTVSSYQSVSGAGLAAIDEVVQEMRIAVDCAGELTNGTRVEMPTPNAFVKTVGANVVPFAGDLVDDETSEEHKFRNETRKILEDATLDVSCTCVRVPVIVGHSMAIDVDFAADIELNQIKNALEHAPGVALMDVPTALDASGGDVTLVGRLRTSALHKNRLKMFIAGDNLRKGAALNAVQVAELVVAAKF